MPTGGSKRPASRSGVQRRKVTTKAGVKGSLRNVPKNPGARGGPRKP